MKRIAFYHLLFFALLLPQLKLHAQNRMDIGAHFAFNRDISRIIPGDDVVLQKSRFLGFAGGGFWAYQLPNEQSWLEFNVNYFRTWVTVGSDSDFFSKVSSSGEEVATFGLAFRHRIPLFTAANGKGLYLSPRAGLELGWVGRPGHGFYISSNTPSGGVEIFYEMPIRDDIFTAFALLGANLEYEFKRGITLYSRMAYHQGFQKIFDETISYTLNNGPQTDLDFFSRGSRWAWEFGLSYPISKLWQKGDQ